jgi:glucoamylase
VVHVAPGVRATVSPVGGSLRFRQVTRSPGRWRLTKTDIADPARATVLVRVRFEALGPDPLWLYVLADPAPGDDGNDDRSAPSADRLLAFDDAAASAVAASPALSETSSGYRGSESDPWQQLRSGMALTSYDAAAPGNVVQGARTALDGRRHRRMTLAIGFGPTTSAASAAADASLARLFGRARDRFDAGWRRYLDSLDAPPAVVARDRDLRRVYRQSLLVLAASEDKLNPGASIAAPNMPWVWGTLTLENHEFSGPYHLVWPRDFYHVATAQKAAGDDAGAGRLLDYLWRVQKPDGSWWQNTRVDGTPYWTSLQLDEVALRSCSRGGLAGGAPPTGSTCARRPTSSSRTGRGRSRSAGRTRTASRPTRSPRRSRR